MVYNHFSVVGPRGDRYAPIVAGGREPALNTGVLAAQGQVSGYVTIEAPARGTLVYDSGSAGRTASWPYARA